MYPNMFHIEFEETKWVVTVLMAAAEMLVRVARLKVTHDAVPPPCDPSQESIRHQMPGATPIELQKCRSRFCKGVIGKKKNAYIP
jgi:hypothetical protein